MHFRSFLLPAIASLACLPVVSTQILESESLNTCQSDSLITATLFNVVYTANNRTLAYNVVANAEVTGKVTVLLEVIAYGYTAVTETIDPCASTLTSNFCPIQNTGPLNLQGNVEIPASITSKIPGVAFTVPDLDGLVRIYINSIEQNKTVACVEAVLSNGKTVYQKAVGWSIAAVAGLALAASAIASGLGFSNTAAHVAADALALFSFFQAQAMFGMLAIGMPPIVESWTQNFQWSMGIIRVGFLQTISTWYQMATGGTPSTILSELNKQSVEVQKRSLSANALTHIATRTFHRLLKRAASSSSDSSDSSTSSPNVIMGIDRVGFRAGIEESNIFMTGLIFFIAFVLLTTIIVASFKAYTKLAIRQGWMPHTSFQDFRNGWTSVLRGILYRLVLIGFPQMVVLCLWELTRRDSVAEVILAVLMFVSMTGILGWAAIRVIALAKRSVTMHRNPAYILYSNPKFLHTWGFLYVQYRATAHYWVVPALVYIFAKGAFIALAQGSGIVQAIGLLIIETSALVASAIFRPWMDKKTNTFNIAILVVHFINAVCLLMFTSIFNQPAIVNGVLGVVFFVYNAVFAFILLVLVLIASVFAILSKNPDARYEPVRDDRGSFIRSQTGLNDELDALGKTARGESKKGYE